jgi:hypothetical protein
MHSNALSVRMIYAFEWTRPFERNLFHVKQEFSLNEIRNIFLQLETACSWQVQLSTPTICAIVDTPTFRSIVDAPTLSIRTPRRMANAHIVRTLVQALEPEVLFFENY